MIFVFMELLFFEKCFFTFVFNGFTSTYFTCSRELDISSKELRLTQKDAQKVPAFLRALLLIRCV